MDSKTTHLAEWCERQEREREDAMGEIDRIKRSLDEILEFLVDRIERIQTMRVDLVSRIISPLIVDQRCQVLEECEHCAAAVVPD